jgi:UDP-3-O-[3-hydroxymyristoyl] glucosamine N-acyltransferase
LPGTKIADQCDIQENTVIGSIAMAYEGRQRIPQVGGIYIDNHVSIGANCIIDRGAIDDTYIGENVAIGSICAIGHNVTLAPCCMVIAGTVLFGSVSIGESAYISGNVVIKNGITIGANAYVGMGSVVTQNVPAGKTVFGNPARILRSPE